MSTYYVSTGGNDANAGTASTTAWQTIAKVNSRSYSAGDSILFEGGKTFSGRIYLDARSAGTADGPITISSYGSGRATIDGGLANGLYAYNSAGIKITNLKFSGAGAGNTGAGIIFYCDLANNVKLNYVEISDVEVSGFRDGIRIGGKNDKSGYNNVRLLRAVIHDNQCDGVRTSGYAMFALSNVYVGHCQFFNNTGDPALTTNSGSGLVLGQVDGAIVERCLAHDNGALCMAVEGGCGIWCHDSNGVLIQSNESWNNHTGATNDGGGFDLDGGTTHSILQYNYSHDNDGAGLAMYQFITAGTWGKNIVRYNISQNDGRKNSFAGIQVADNGGGLSDCEVYNNVVFMSPTSSGTPRAVWFLSSSTNFHLRNNVFITTSGLPLLDVVGTQAGWMFQNNAYWSSGDAWNVLWDKINFTDLPSWRLYTGQETMNELQLGMVVDPLLLNPGGGVTLGDAGQLESMTAYLPQTSSPLLEAGMNLPAVFGIDPGPRDFFGNTLPQYNAYDVGACEYPGSINTPATQASAVNGATSPLTVIALTASAGATPKSGRVTLKATLANLPADSSLAGQPLTVDIAGASAAFTLDRGGRAAWDQGRVQLKWVRSSNKSQTSVSIPVFTVSLQKGDWSSIWTQRGLFTGPNSSKRTDVPVSLMNGDKVYVATFKAGCTSRHGKYRISK
jgi:hypothetical protein